MRFAVLVLLFSASVAAQAPAGRGGAPPPPPAPKNLKVLPADTEILFAMKVFTEALGVQCTYCHVAGDYASDANPKKEVARTMINLVKQIDQSFPNSTGVFPAGYHEVDCTTCHRGSVTPETKAPKEFVNRGEQLGTIVPGDAPGINLKLLPPDTRVHGAGIMHDFRDALNVDCGYCHGGPNPRNYEVEVNPRKSIARTMILLTRQINAKFPGTGVFPNGKQEVTCYTCHRGETHPAAMNNRPFDLQPK